MNNAMKRTVYFVSESTGITAEALGHSLISQFDTVNFEQVYMPLINTIPRAVALTERMQEAANRDGARPICFATMMNTEIRNILKAGNCFYMELFDVFIDPLAAELGVPPSRRAGLSHAITQVSSYTKRIAAINFAMANDDGMHPENFPRADLILIGVSRVGKTPTSLYLAMHFALSTANYPITEENFERGDVSQSVWDCRHKIFGLTIEPERLHLIREERRAGSEYASLERCQDDVRRAGAIFKQLDIQVIDTTSQSIEEISSYILRTLKEGVG
jgi:regulator of PEP synthase PpsR (kinase-PPPase family)